jgi:SnoaL-like domain
MPWLPELFSGPALERIFNQAAADARAAAPVPYFAGVRSGETDALVGSFAGEPELHHPFRGRVKGRRAFERFVIETNGWLTARNAVVGHVERIITPRRGIEETAVTLDGDRGRIELPIAIAADRDEDARIIELRVYYGTWPFDGRHANRPPLLQPDADLQGPDVVGEYQRALAAGDVEAAVAAFESDAYVREPAGGAYVHHGRDELVALYERFFSNDGGIPLEYCAVTDDGRSCALEYNVVRWGRTELPPQAGVAVYVRGDSGKLASARIYDDADPPLRSEQETRA